MIEGMKIVDVDAMTEIYNTLSELANQVDQTPSYFSEVLSQLGYTANYSYTTYQFQSLSDQAEIIAQKIRELIEWIAVATEEVVRIDEANAEENYEEMNEEGGNGGIEDGTTTGSSSGGSSSGGSSGGGSSGGGSGTGTGTSHITSEELTEPDLDDDDDDDNTQSSSEDTKQEETSKNNDNNNPTSNTQVETKEQNEQQQQQTDNQKQEESTTSNKEEKQTEPTTSADSSESGAGGGGAGDLKTSLSDALDQATKKEEKDADSKVGGTGNLVDASRITPSASSKGATRSINPWAIAGLGLAAGSIALGTGLLVKYNSYYTFGPEDWTILNSAIQNTILNDFKEAGFTKEEVETFINSTFKVKAVDFDKHIKNVKRANELDVSLELELNDLYGFSCYDSDGKLVKYALFIMMIIDGKNATDIFNIYNILNTSLDENDMDLIYSGIDLYEYIEDEYTTTETIEEETEPQTEPSTTDYFS